MTQLSNGTIVTDIDATHDNDALTAQGYTKGIRDKRDVSYQRPLSLDATPERW